MGMGGGKGKEWGEESEAEPLKKSGAKRSPLSKKKREDLGEACLTKREPASGKRLEGDGKRRGGIESNPIGRTSLSFRMGPLSWEKLLGGRGGKACAVSRRTSPRSLKTGKKEKRSAERKS